MKIQRAFSVLALAAIAAAMLAAAQGRLTGKVTGPDGAPLADVVLTMTTPNLTTFKLSVKTDKKGQYAMIVNDATIPYHLRYELEGFVPHEENKKLSIGEPTVVDVQLKKPTAAAAPAVVSTTDQAAILYNEGVDLLNGGDKSGAEAKFREAVTKNPDLPQGWQGLAVLAFRNKEWAKALDAGQKAIDLDPTLTSLYPMMIEASRQKGDQKAAAEWQAKYNEANPDTPEVIYNKGVDALNSKKMQEAAAFFTQAIEAKPDYAMAHYQLGMVDFNLKKNAAAREHLEKYIELAPDGSEVETAKEILSVLK